ncbi:MAG TPA: hypothetical protein VMV18_10160, partial [bacterium]|nr:hypothetical protein [bacterium]
MKLTVEIRHSDGTREEISLADAILIYEKRRDAAKDERERRHCEQRIADLQKRWKKALRGTERAKTTATVKPSERPTRTRTQRRARRVVSA